MIAGGGGAMIDWQRMSEDQIRQELKGAGIEPLGVEVNTTILTVWTKCPPSIIDVV